MGNVNRVPKGLLSLLDSQTQGQNPNTLLNEVSPVLEIGDYWYANKGLESAFSTGPDLTVIGTSSTEIVVPDGEMWVVQSVSGEMILLDVLNINTRMAINFRLNTSAENSRIATNSTAGLFQTSVQSCSIAYPRYFFAPSGSQWFLSLDHTSVALVAGLTPSTNVLFYRLQV